MLNNIRDSLQMGISIGDKQYFLLMYRSLLTERLVKYHSNPGIELELMKMFFSYKEDPELYAKIKFQIHDSIASRKYTDIFRQIKVDKATPRFAAYDINKLKRENCNFLITRQYAWDYKTSEQYNLPDEIAIYLAIFEAYFKAKETSRHKKLSLLHDISIGTLKLKLANREEYSIQMTLPQMSILLTIANANNTISARDISNQLNIPLNKLSPVFNSLLDADLIIRGKGPRNDPNIIFSINWEKSYPSKKFTLVPSVKQFQDSQNHDQNINITVLRVKLLMIMMNNKKLLFDDIKSNLEKIMNINLNNKLLDEELNRAITSNTITKDGDYYLYSTILRNNLIDEEDEIDDPIENLDDNNNNNNNHKITNQIIEHTL